MEEKKLTLITELLVIEKSEKLLNLFLRYLLVLLSSLKVGNSTFRWLKEFSVAFIYLSLMLFLNWSILDILILLTLIIIKWIEFFFTISDFLTIYMN